MPDLVIWIGLILFIAMILASAFIYSQSDKVDAKYKKNIEIIRAIKAQKLKDILQKYYDEEAERADGMIDMDNLLSGGEFSDIQKQRLESNKGLNQIMKKSADLKMWFDYLPKAKEFLISASLWLFLIGVAVLAFCLSIWAELITAGTVRYAGYLSIIWIFMGIRLFRNILRFNIVKKNINDHMDMLRDGDIDKF